MHNTYLTVFIGLLMNEIFDKLGKKFPFLSLIQKGDLEFVGIVQNQDNQVTSFYDYGRIMMPQDKATFLKMGETWWWESNRKIPINIFMKSDMTPFRNLIKTFATKDVELLFGPMVRLNDITEKRIKRKSIQLIRKIK